MPESSMQHQRLLPVRPTVTLAHAGIAYSEHASAPLHARIHMRALSNRGRVRSPTGALQPWHSHSKGFGTIRQVALVLGIELALGPKTIHFWAPAMKWGLVIAGISDINRPAEQISVFQSSGSAARV